LPEQINIVIQNADEETEAWTTGAGERRWRTALANGETPVRALRLPDQLWMAVDRWRKEAVRRLLAFALAMNPKLDGTESN
jgi:hypothetical protein